MLLINSFRLSCLILNSCTITQVVALTFVQFATEPNYDFVKLYDGHDCTAGLIAALSGFPNSTEFYSTQQYMFIEFISDFSVVLSGFNATYQSVMPTSTPTPSEYEYAAFRSGSSKDTCAVFCLL